MLEKRSYSKRACFLQSQKRHLRASKKSNSSSTEQQSAKVRKAIQPSFQNIKPVCEKSIPQSPRSNSGKANTCASPTGTLPPRTINAEEEDEIVAQLAAYQRERLTIDPMRELDEALMDRTTASQNRKHKIIHITSSSSN